ncbi:hypothetical protein JCM10207_006923 [Rhodosporidiobolus poonsookiae]
MASSSAAADTPASTPAPPASSAPPSSKSLPASWHLASGALSGAASVLALQPLDLIKTRIQQAPVEAAQPAVRLAATTGSGAAAVLEQPAPRPRAVQIKIWHTAREVVRTDGMRGLWRGTGPTLYRNVPGVSMYFLTLSRLRDLVGRSAVFRAKGASPAGGKIKLTTAGDLIVGSVARTGVGFLLMPFTLLKTISESSLTLPASAASSAATHRAATPSTLTALRTLYHSGGIRSLWRGAVPTALRDAPGAGLFIVFYERGRRLLGVRGDGGGGAVGGGMAGAAASLASTLLTTPFDLLKTRRQLSPQQYTSLWSSVLLVYRTNGLRGFWEGGGLRVVRKAGSAGIGWAVYEAFVGVGEKRARGGEGERERRRSGGG